MKYRPDIDGLRALAVLAVVGYHAFPTIVKGGFIGVDVFFVISGFLISAIIMGNLERNSFSFVDFYSRRVRRIFPALLVVMLASYAIGWFIFFDFEFRQLGKHIAAGAGFASNLVLWGESGYFDNLGDTKPLLHLWSLGIEEQFYIVWPLLLGFAWKRRLRIPTVIAVLGAVSFSLSIALVDSHPVAAFFSPLTRAWELLTGCLLACWNRDKEDNFRYAGPALSNTLATLGLAAIFAPMLIVTKDSAFPGWWAVLPVAGSAMLVAASPQAWINRIVLSNRVLVWFGLISFPLYLWHWPLLSFLSILNGGPTPREVRAIAVVVSIGLAYITYRVIEQPFRMASKAGRRTKTVALAAIMFSIGCIGWITYTQNGFRSRSIVVSHKDSVEFRAYGRNPLSSCAVGHISSVVAEHCAEYVDPNPTRRVLLWGDSSVQAWLPVFLEIGKEKHYTLITLSLPSCPPLKDVRKTHFDFPESRAYCSDGKVQGQMVNLIRSIHPDLVVVIANWNAYSPHAHSEFITDLASGAADAGTTRAAIEKRVPETLAELDSITKVLVFSSWPDMSDATGARTSISELLRRMPNPRSIDVAEFKKDSALITAVFSKTTLPHTKFYDPAAKICTNRCVDYLNGVKLYGDSYHISERGALLFHDDLEKLTD